MFTGIVQGVGRVVADSPAGEGRRIAVDARTLDVADVAIGDSVAVDGCCLTVVALDGALMRFDVSAETLSRTAGMQLGAEVNLEKSLRLADRLGGHLVQGHVDGVGTVVTPAPDLRVALPDGLGRYLVEKGSITVDGVSLTVVEAAHDSFTVAVIPHTCEVTTLGRRAPGDAVNLEVDVTAKYVERLLDWKAG